MTLQPAERHVLPLPVALEEVDRAWLTAALRTRTPGARVNDFDVVDINRSTCTKIRLRLDLNAAGRSAGIPESVILKGGFEAHSRDLDYMHQSEVRGYRDVLPVLRLNSPACYFAEFDPERRQGIIIMEDLVARGVEFCHPLRPQAFDAVTRRLTALARHHAQTWGSPDCQPGGRWDWLGEMAPGFRAHVDQYLQPAVWQGFVDRPRGAAASVRFHDVTWMTDSLERLIRLSRRLPACVIHGDTHLGNLYVERDGAPGFFDSLPQRSAGIQEVAYHIACALDTADRRRWESALVQHYLDELDRSGAAPPAFDAAMRDYGAFLALGYCIFLINESFFQSEACNTAYTARFSAAMIDHDTIGLLRSIP